MNNFEFYSPTCFVFGKDTETSAGEYVKRFGGSKVLIHYGGGSAVRSGLLDRIKESLSKESIAFSPYASSLKLLPMIGTFISSIFSAFQLLFFRT